MFTQLSRVLQLLHLNYYIDGNNILIINQENNKSCLLQQDENFDCSFSIEINGEMVSCTFSGIRETINIEIGDNKKVFIDEVNLCYSRRETDKNDFSFASFVLGQDYTFFRESGDISTRINVNLDDEDDYVGLNHTESVRDRNGITKGETQVINKHNAHMKYISHRYDLSGKMVMGSMFEKDLQVPLKQHIEGVLERDTTVEEILNEMEDSLPGIINYSKDTFPFIYQLYKTEKDQLESILY